MKHKVMMIAVILLAALLMVFLQKAFNNIQKADIDFTDATGPASERLESIADDVIDSYDVMFVDETSLRDLNLGILLLDHAEASALLIKDGTKKNIDYGSIPTSVSYCNTYIVEANQMETMIINTDVLLGDPFVRTIAYGYHYRFAKMNTLNPESIDYFITTQQNKETRFLRYMMIESAKAALLDDTNMDVLSYYYDEWGTRISDDVRNNVSNYDFYDGFLSYVSWKAMLYQDPDIALSQYLDGFINEDHIYDQDTEFRVMGLLYCLLAEREGIALIDTGKRPVNRYSALLRNSVIGDGDALESDKRVQFEVNLSSHISQVESMIQMNQATLDSGKKKDIVITAESYEHAIAVEDNAYIYMNYQARLEDGSIFEVPYQVVRITPIKVYYLE